MKISEPLFDEILENNQLIKGRLRLKKHDLEKLYKVLGKKNDMLEKKLAHQEELIRSNVTKRNKINFQIKKNSESIKKSFYPSSNKISRVELSSYCVVTIKKLPFTTIVV